MAASGSERGFSLVELMIVLVIASVLMTIGAPSMGTFMRNNRLTADANEVFRSVQFARGEAVKRKSQVVMCRSANPRAATPSCGGTSYTWTSGWLVFASNDGNSTYQAGVDELLRIGRPRIGDVSIITNSTSNNNLQFKPDGTTDEGGGTARFAICDDRGGAHGYQVNVPALGRPRQVRGSSADQVNCTSPS